MTTSESTRGTPTDIAGRIPDEALLLGNGQPLGTETSEDDQVTAIRRRFEAQRRTDTPLDAHVTARDALVAIGNSRETADKVVQRWDAAADPSNPNARIMSCRSLAQSLRARFTRPSAVAETYKPVRCELRLSSQASARGEDELDALLNALMRMGMTLDEACEVKHLVRMAREIEESDEAA